MFCAIVGDQWLLDWPSAGAVSTRETRFFPRTTSPHDFYEKYGGGVTSALHSIVRTFSLCRRRKMPYLTTCLRICGEIFWSRYDSRRLLWALGPNIGERIH